MSSYRHGLGTRTTRNRSSNPTASYTRTSLISGLACGLDDPPATVHVEDVGAVHSADELGTEPDDLVESPADPVLRSVEDFRVPVDGRDQGAYEDFRIPEATHENPWRAGTVQG